MFYEHLQPDVNAYGQPWKSRKQTLTKRKGLEIWSSSIPGQERMVWKCRFTISGNLGLSSIIEENRNWEKRLKWDKKCLQGAVWKSFEEACDVSLSCVKPHGALHVREFVELRCWRGSLDGRSFLHTATSLPYEDQPCGDVLDGLPPPSKGFVRATTFPGTGAQWTKQTPLGGSAICENSWEVVTVTEIDPKGRTPMSVINRAMNMSLLEVYQCVTKRFSSFPDDGGIVDTQPSTAVQHRIENKSFQFAL